MDGPEFALPAEMANDLSGLLPPAAWRSTVPILVIQGESIRQHGTGILFRVAEVSFLVTAAHVIQEAAKHQLRLGILAAGHDSPLLPSARDIQSTVPDHGSVDHLDVAIWRLDSFSVRALSGNSFLHLPDTLLSDNFEQDIYFVCGFLCEASTPSDSASQRGTSQPLQFGTTLFAGDVAGLAGLHFNRRQHILLDANRNFLTNMSGPLATLPTKFNGLSGCGIWKSKAMSTRRIDWKPGQAKLVAVVTSAYPEHSTHDIIKGTTWTAVASLIAAVYPELKPSFALDFPF